MVSDTSSEASSAMVTVRANGRNSSPGKVAHKGDGQEHGHRGQRRGGDGAGHFADGGEDGR